MRSLTFLPCFAHQLNLCVGEIFKESVEFKNTIDKSIKLATYFRNSNNKFFIANLKELQYETYKKYIIPIVPAETRWNSIYMMCTSLLNIQKALQILAIKFEPPIVESRRKSGDSPKISRAIFEIINSEAFWRNLLSITKILDPYNKILNVLQRDKARLFQVVHSFGYLAQFWSKYEDIEFAAKIIARLENRWKSWEQPLLILSCLLHPEYKMECFNNNIFNINYSVFGRWIIYYYRAWSGKDSKCILREFDDFRLSKYPFDINSYNHFDGDVWRYWCYISVSTNELGFVACRIFGICINAASVERLWSCMGFLQTNRRNRLMSSRALEMSKLRADITYSHRLISTTSKPSFNNAIFEIAEDNENNDQDHEENNDENLVDENLVNNNKNLDDDENLIDEDCDEEFENENIDQLNIENDFGEYLQGWVEMLREEKNAIDDDNYDDENIMVDNIIHPAVDTNAKWELTTLFKNNLKLPF
ncbi:hypothetical protein Glove_357g58 [Diversispora epigaea]|uniref:HAT C-terminal dimerisation domain-containing protein n=1 Tax=Diversispora epigaea TaxID=1348612 RepID=A0A397HDR1_9GLOM|nr:hypothetical protein Glove_357g58 [Diversispora epigaea]